jgi:uncharacterized protein (DUF433 family)
MNWQNYIEINPQILAGKPVIKGTRLSIEFLLDLLANNWTVEQLLENYRKLTRQDIQAIGSVFNLLLNFSNSFTKFISVNKQSNNSIVHFFGFRKTNCFSC